MATPLKDVEINIDFQNLFVTRFSIFSLILLLRNLALTSSKIHRSILFLWKILHDFDRILSTLSHCAAHGTLALLPTDVILRSFIGESRGFFT